MEFGGGGGKRSEDRGQNGMSHLLDRGYYGRWRNT